MAVGLEGAAGAQRPRARAWLQRADAASPATLLFAAAMLASAFVLLLWLSELTFWRDEWAFLLHRRGLGADVFLDPHYEHISIAPIAIYKALLATFGMDSPRPFQIAAVALFLAAVALLYAYLRRRVGGWLALAGVLPLLFFGASWDDLLWPFQIGFFGSLVGGIAAMLALERGDRRGDLAACGLLVLAMSFSSLGLAFAAGCAAIVLCGPRPWRGRLFVVAVPAAAFALWWLGWGREAESFLSWHNFATSPSYVLDGWASALSSLLGLATVRDEVELGPLDWGRSLLVGAVLVAGVVLHRRGRIPAAILPPLVAGTAFWFLAGLNASFYRFPESGRYQLLGAVFVLMLAAQLARGVSPRRWALITILAVAAFAAIANLSTLHRFWTGLKPFGEQQPGGLAALELARERVDPGFQLTEQNSGVDYLGELDAASYLDAVDDYGSPAYSAAELAGASELARTSADTVSAAALGVELRPAPGPAGECTRTRPPAGETSVVELPAGGALLRPSRAGSAELALRRFAAASFPVELGSAPAGKLTALTIPADASREPWELAVSGATAVDVCAAGSGG